MSTPKDKKWVKNAAFIVEIKEQNFSAKLYVLENYDIFLYIKLYI